MFGNVGERYVQIKRLNLKSLILNEVGTEFVIQEYYSVPHGYAAIKHNDVLLFIPDEIFEKHFVTWEKYKQYYNYGDSIMINANGNLRTYSIESINGDSHYVTLSLTAVD